MPAGTDTLTIHVFVMAQLYPAQFLARGRFEIQDIKARTGRECVPLQGFTTQRTPLGPMGNRLAHR